MKRSGLFVLPSIPSTAIQAQIQIDKPWTRASVPGAQVAGG